MFVLLFVIIPKEAYVNRICPELQRFKFEFWGHDEVVLHEHEIRKPFGDFLMGDKEAALKMRRASGKSQKPSADRKFPVQLGVTILQPA